jgi:quercetin dioxygenase-like cupin family protein
MATIAESVRIGTYIKEVIRREEGKDEISHIRWEPGSRTPRHDHSVAEVTYVLEGRIFQIIDGQKTYHPQGSKLKIPVGIIHEVGVDATDGPAFTLNICDGLLTMNTYPSSDVK